MFNQRMTGSDLERMLRQMLPEANIELHPDAEVNVTYLSSPDEAGTVAGREPPVYSRGDSARAAEVIRQCRRLDNKRQ